MQLDHRTALQPVKNKLAFHWHNFQLFKSQLLWKPIKNFFYHLSCCGVTKR